MDILGRSYMSIINYFLLIIFLKLFLTVVKLLLSLKRSLWFVFHPLKFS